MFAEQFLKALGEAGKDRIAPVLDPLMASPTPAPIPLSGGESGALRDRSGHRAGGSSGGVQGRKGYGG